MHAKPKSICSTQSKTMIRSKEVQFVGCSNTRVADESINGKPIFVVALTGLVETALLGAWVT